MHDATRSSPASNASASSPLTSKPLASKPSSSAQGSLSTDSLDLQRVDLTVTVHAHIEYTTLERMLHSEGFTLGWGPVPGNARTIGGLLETRARGLRSGLYGEVSRACIALGGELPGGVQVNSRCVPRSAAGPDFKHLLMGGHGKTGQIHRATLRVYPLPALRLPTLLQFQDPLQAFHFGMELLHCGAFPALFWLRLPAHDADGSLSGPTELLLTFEGEVDLTQARQRIAHRRVKEQCSPSTEAGLTGKRITESALTDASQALNQLEYWAEHPELATASDGEPAPSVVLLHQPWFKRVLSTAELERFLVAYSTSRALNHGSHRDNHPQSAEKIPGETLPWDKLSVAITSPTHEDACLLVAPRVAGTELTPSHLAALLHPVTAAPLVASGSTPGSLERLLHHLEGFDDQTTSGGDHG